MAPATTKKKASTAATAPSAAASAAAAASASELNSKMQARARSIHRVLDFLYPNPPIPLDHDSNFTLLIAVSKRLKWAQSRGFG
jgi:hypothetical protein